MIIKKKKDTAGSTRSVPDSETIALAYRLFLDREPSVIELEEMRAKGKTLQELRSTFLKSPEFRNKVQLSEGTIDKAADAERNGRALIHIHMPKTAGRTLNYLLQENFSKDASALLLDDDLRQIAKRPPAERNALRFIYGHISRSVLETATRSLPQGHMYMTLLREPQSRLLSLYRYIQRTPNHPMHAAVTADQMSFGEFLEHATEVKFPLQEIDNGQMRRLASRRVPPPRTDLLPMLFQQALHNMFADNMIYGLTEHFDDFLVLLVERKILANRSEKRINSSPVPTKIDAVLDELSTHQKTLLHRFTVWDTRFYEICRDAYLAQRQTPTSEG